MKEVYSIKDFCIVHNNKISTKSGIQESFTGLPYNQFIIKLYQHFSINYPKFYKMDNLSKLGFISSELLLKDKNILDKYTPDEVGIILSNSSSSLDADKNHQNSIKNKSDYFPSPAVFVYTLANIMIGEICIRHKFTGEGQFFVSEKFDAEFLYNYVNELFTNNIFKCCLTGWIEADGENYRSVLYFVEKDQINDRIIIFEPSRLNNIFNEKF